VPSDCWDLEEEATPTVDFPFDIPSTAWPEMTHFGTRSHFRDCAVAIGLGA
jgi:hypothetical protein